MNIYFFKSNLKLYVSNHRHPKYENYFKEIYIILLLKFRVDGQ